MEIIKTIALTVGLILLAFLLKRVFWHGKKPPRYPYQRNGMLFTADEKAFFRTLKDTIGDNYEVFGKILAAHIIVPKKGASAHAVKKAFNSIDDRYFDFVLCEKSNLAVVCVVQLQNKNHSVRLNDKDPLIPICENLGLPLFRFASAADYSVEEIRETLRKTLIKEPCLLVETDGRKEPRISSIDGIKFPD